MHTTHHAGSESWNRDILTRLAALGTLSRSERLKELTIDWISTVRSSRQPLRGFLRMRNSINAIKDFPHAEERPWARLEARNDADAALARAAQSILSQAQCGKGVRRLR